MTADGKVVVLLVDDDANVRIAVNIGLKRCGFEVEETNNGVQALATLDDVTNEIDVILLDLLMPVMTGYEFLEKYQGPVPVIVMSGFGDIAKLPRQPFALVAKPMSVTEIADTIREAATSWRPAP